MSPSMFLPVAKVVGPSAGTMAPIDPASSFINTTRDHVFIFSRSLLQTPSLRNLKGMDAGNICWVRGTLMKPPDVPGRCHSARNARPWNA